VDFDAKKKSTTDHAFCIRQILEKRGKHKEAVHQLFIEFKIAYNSETTEVMHNTRILIEFSIPMELVQLIKICLYEIYSRVRVVKLSYERLRIINGVKQGDALSPLFFNFTLEYAIRSVQVNQGCLKLNGAHQILVYADDVSVLGGSVHTIKGKKQTLF